MTLLEKAGSNLTDLQSDRSSLGQGEARHRKYKTFELGSGQAYQRSSE
jgi:hypothetical protein